MATTTRKGTTRKKKPTLIGKIRKGWATAVSRWKAKTPVFFSNAIKVALAISGTAAAIHAAVVQGGAREPEWWVSVYPYLIGVPAGMAAMAKFTQTYDTPKRKTAPKKKQTAGKGTINK